MLNPITLAPGQEQYEKFTPSYGRKYGPRYQYDYRHTDGKLFSCVKKTLELCRAEQDEWLDKKNAMA